MNTTEITITPEIRSANNVVNFAVGTPDSNGQQWMGYTKGQHEIGEWIDVRKQVGPVEHEESRVEVIAKETPVTGAIILTVQWPAKIK